MIEHGLGRYQRYGCRCDVCRAANAQASREARARRKAIAAAEETAHAVPHGAGGYTNWGCRCKDCKAGHAAEQRYSRI